MSSDVLNHHSPNRMRLRDLRPSHRKWGAVLSAGRIVGTTILAGVLSMGTVLAATPAATAAATAGGGTVLQLSRAVPNVETRTVITSDSRTATGAPVTLSARTTPRWGGVGVPAGTVQFRIDGLEVGTATVDPSGNASLTIPARDVAFGKHSVTAIFRGAPGWAWSASFPTMVDVGVDTVSFAKIGAADLQLLEVNGNAMHDGAIVDTWVQFLDHGRPQGNQRWRMWPAEDGSDYYQIINVTTGKCLEVNGTDGKVDQWRCVPGADNQLWKLTTSHTKQRDSLQVRSTREYLGTTAEGGAPVSSGNGTKLVMHRTRSAHTEWFASWVPHY